jgi:voltage-gated potassium channel
MLTERRVMRRLMRAFETGRVLPALFVTMIGIVFVFAGVMRVVDHTDFPTYGRALWWAVATVTTVGYGDVVPTQPFGRIVAGFLMLAGFGFLSLLTGTVASTLVSRRRSAEKELLAALSEITRRLDELERRMPGSQG